MNTSTVISVVSPIKQAKRLIRILISLPTCSVMVPLQLFSIFILFRYKNFRENASLQLVARLVILDMLQALALFISGLYAIEPSIAEFLPLQRLCGVALTCLFMALFPLQFELTIYRIMVVTKACKHHKLPLLIKIAEGILWIFIVVLSVGCYVSNAYVFTAPAWDYDTTTFVGDALSKMELFFCIPFLVVTYVLYMFLISMVFMEKKLFTKYKNPKEEWFLFIQSTTSTVAHLVQITLYHIPAADDCATAYKCKSPWTDLKTIIRCRLTTILDLDGLETVDQLLAQQCCNGSTIDDIGSNFMSTMQKGASSSAYSKMAGVLVPFSQCLSQKGSNMNKAMAAVGAGMKKAIGSTYLEVQKAVTSFKGKCTTTAMYNALGKKFCPLFTKVLVQKVINATRKEMGNSWSCSPDKLSPTILNFTSYITK